MKEPKLNLKLLRKVRNRIAEIPESYEQRTFGQRNDAAPCGTVSCLFGEAVICDSVSVKAGIRRLFRAIDDPNIDIIDYGARLLGLSHEDALEMAEYLPMGGESGRRVKWPEPYATRFTKAETSKAQAKVAVAYLDECLKRKAVTW